MKKKKRIKTFVNLESNENKKKSMEINAGDSGE